MRWSHDRGSIQISDRPGHTKHPVVRACREAVLLGRGGKKRACS